MECDLVSISRDLRETIIRTAFACGQAAHLGGALSMTDILAVLYWRGLMNYRPTEPRWEERDIFILSKGHAVLGHLAVLNRIGTISDEDLKTFQTNGSKLIAHPIKNLEYGIESSNGSLGQGLSYGLGMAVGYLRRNLANKVFVMMGDGECNEGSVWEAAALAAELQADNLIGIVDVNRLRNDGANSLFPSAERLASVWRSFGWDVHEVDGHDFGEIEAALRGALEREETPSVIVANTVKGKGISFMENNNDWHHNRITETILKESLSELGLTP
jgi:transketolase